MKIDEYSNVLLTGYLFNTTGLPLSLATLLKGGTLSFPSFQDTKNIFAEVEDKRITHFMLQPYGIAQAFSDPNLEQRDLQCLKLIAYGAAPMPQPLLQKVRKAVCCEWLQGYGLTESCGPITWLNENDHLTKPDSVGRAGKDSLISIIGEERERLQPYEVGEIAIHASVAMLGYWDSTLERPLPVSNDVFLTGDLGYVDEEGFLYLRGRKKEVIVTGDGFTLCPKEIEDVIQTFENVEEVAVIGWKDKADEFEYPVAFVKSIIE